MELTVAEKIRLIMKRKGMTMGELAEATGQTRQNLSNKMARGNFTEKDIQELSFALGCTAEILFRLPDGTTV
jgi:transcriptional regulator with XRE-family HTH domain